jgi:hypothetical protein
VASQVVGADLPAWSDAFALERYADPAYLRTLATLATGQL